MLLANQRQYSNNRVNEQDVLAEWYKTSSQIVVNEQNHELTSLILRETAKRSACQLDEPKIHLINALHIDRRRYNVYFQVYC